MVTGIGPAVPPGPRTVSVNVLVPTVVGLNVALADAAPVIVTGGPAVCTQVYVSISPVEPVPSRMICWPTTPLVGARAATTGGSGTKAVPLLPASGTVVEPPMDDVTVTADGGDRTLANGVAVTEPKPSTLNTPGVPSASLEV